jgi:hypothetical protein
MRAVTEQVNQTPIEEDIESAVKVGERQGDLN